jgi:2-keto-3-deoxy-L-rhamnonate aldolase RhmA
MLSTRRHRAAITTRAGPDSSTSSSKSGASYGIFVISASPVCAEAVAVSGVDWLCLDAQHGAVSDACLAQLAAAALCLSSKHSVGVLCCLNSLF